MRLQNIRAKQFLGKVIRSGREAANKLFPVITPKNSDYKINAVSMSSNLLCFASNHDVGGLS